VLIEVRKAGFINKGAQLMLLAILQEVSRRFPNAQFAMAPSRKGTSQPVDRIRDQGMLAKASLWRAGRQWGDLAALVPSTVRESLGLALDRDIDTVLDAAGFAYGSPWPTRSLEELAAAAARWRQRGTALVLMPQAFGRIERPEDVRHLRIVADTARRIYARDTLSLDHLRAVVGEHASLRQAPDFTSLLPGLPPNADLKRQLSETIAIVPNARMLDRTDRVAGSRYLPFLEACIGSLSRAGLQIALVVHGGAEDLALANQLRNRHPQCRLVDERHPLKIKGFLGACRGSIGSRYHGLINCLSQGVPAFGTSWSHKYQALYADYDFGAGLISELSASVADEVCRHLLDDTWIGATRAHLVQSAERQKDASRVMWEDIFGVIESATQTRAKT
jgi:colanic acid/amylovoran biosynthesis protein